MDYRAFLVHFFTYLALAQTQTIYTTKPNVEGKCSSLLTLDSVFEALKSLIKFPHHSSGEIAQKLRFGVTNLYNVKIEGLDQMIVSQPLEFERLSVQGDEKTPSIRMRITLNFNFLEIEAQMKVRYTNTRRRMMRAFVKPTQLVIALDFHQATGPITDDKFAHVSSVQITAWEGIRVSGEGIWVRLFRLIHRENQLDRQIRSSIEKLVKKQLDKVLDKYRPSEILKKIFASNKNRNSKRETTKPTTKSIQH